MTPQRVIWHHSADTTQAPQFDVIDLYHKKQHFPKSSLGYYVGYHYLVEPNGEIRQARREDEIGAHDAGENPNSLGICLAGNFSVWRPNESQVVAVCSLVHDIRKRWSIPITRIEPHRWDDLTECPGTLLADDWLTTQYLQRNAVMLARTFHFLGKQLNLL